MCCAQSISSPPPCPKCNQPVTYIEQYQQYYCYNCKLYPFLEPAPAPAQAESVPTTAVPTAPTPAPTAPVEPVPTTAVPTAPTPAPEPQPQPAPLPVEQPPPVAEIATAPPAAQPVIAATPAMPGRGKIFAGLGVMVLGILGVIGVVVDKLALHIVFKNIGFGAYSFTGIAIGVVLLVVGLVLIVLGKKAVGPTAPVTPSAEIQNVCPVCSNPLLFVEQYGQWYCNTCTSYQQPVQQYAAAPQSIPQYQLPPSSPPAY